MHACMAPGLTPSPPTLPPCEGLLKSSKERTVPCESQYNSVSVEYSRKMPRAGEGRVFWRWWPRGRKGQCLLKALAPQGGPVFLREWCILASCGMGELSKF